MKIRKACLDQELLWVVDDVIGGLYSVDQKNYETKCVLDCLELFPHGKFEVQSLIKWKNDYIIMIPLEINRNWIIYNKITGRIEYRKVVTQKCQERLIAIAQDRNQLYFFPLFIHDPAFIVDLDTLKCSQIIDWNCKLSKNCRETAWTGAYTGKYVIYPQKNTKNLVRIDCNTQKVSILKLDILGNVVDINYAFGELWILTIAVNQLYQIDENGCVIDIVKLSIENVTDPLPDFGRIVVQERYIFLLPCYRKGIYI